MKCETCKQYSKITEEKTADGERGYCHRFPPVFFGGGFGFPVVYEHYWCGEYKPQQFSAEAPAEFGADSLEVTR